MAQGAWTKDPLQGLDAVRGAGPALLYPYGMVDPVLVLSLGMLSADVAGVLGSSERRRYYGLIIDSLVDSALGEHALGCVLRNDALVSGVAEVEFSTSSASFLVTQEIVNAGTLRVVILGRHIQVPVQLGKGCKPSGTVTVVVAGLPTCYKKVGVVSALLDCAGYGSPSTHVVHEHRGLFVSPSGCVHTKIGHSNLVAWVQPPPSDRYLERLPRKLELDGKRVTISVPGRVVMDPVPGASAPSSSMHLPSAEVQQLVGQVAALHQQLTTLQGQHHHALQQHQQLHQQHQLLQHEQAQQHAQQQEQDQQHQAQQLQAQQLQEQQLQAQQLQAQQLQEQQLQAQQLQAQQLQEHQLQAQQLQAQEMPEQQLQAQQLQAQQLHEQQLQAQQLQAQQLQAQEMPEQQLQAQQLQAQQLHEQQLQAQQLQAQQLQEQQLQAQQLQAQQLQAQQQAQQAQQLHAEHHQEQNLHAQQQAAQQVHVAQQQLHELQHQGQLLQQHQQAQQLMHGQQLQEQQLQAHQLQAHQHQEQYLQAQQLMHHQQAQPAQQLQAQQQQLVVLPTQQDMQLALVPWQPAVGLVDIEPMDTCTTLTLPAPMHAPHRRTRSRGTATGTPPVDKRGRVRAPLPPSPPLAHPSSSDPGPSCMVAPASKESKKKKQKSQPQQHLQPQPHPQQQSQHQQQSQTQQQKQTQQQNQPNQQQRSLRPRSNGLAHRNDGLYQAMHAWLEDDALGDEDHLTIIKFIDEFAVSHKVLWERHRGVEPRLGAVPQVIKVVVTDMLEGAHADPPPGPSRQSSRVTHPPYPYWLPPSIPQVGSHQHSKVGSRRP
jgi:hypothetical protein